MLTLIWILLTNLFTGTILYLVLSLKLEKSADEFRIKKLRREIDETIREFNATAERNISLLENRIKTAKTVLNGSGLSGIDAFADDSQTPLIMPNRDTVKPAKVQNAKGPNFDFVVNDPLDLSVNEDTLNEQIQQDIDELKKQYELAVSKHDFIAALCREGKSIEDLSLVSGLSHKELSLILHLNGLKAEG